MNTYDGDRVAEVQPERHSGEAGTPGADSAVTPEQEAAAAPQAGDAAATPESLPGAQPRGDAAATPRDEEAHIDLTAPPTLESTPAMENQTVSGGEPSARQQPSPDGEPAEALSCPGCPQQQQQGEGTGERGGEEGEPQRPRILLEAGTDPDSLKALALCREKVQQLHLRMHPLAARWDEDRHVTIFFRADDKVDFRKLVRELSYVLRARIELRQVGPREQGKLCGLVGKCGYQLCCRTFLPQFAQSSIKMAKVQDLALNPMKISGVCGRLLCCLNYEQQMYAEAKSHMPRMNRIVDTEFGQGRVVALNALRNTVTVQFETATRELPPDQVHLAEGQS